MKASKVVDNLLQMCHRCFQPLEDGTQFCGECGHNRSNPCEVWIKSERLTDVEMMKFINDFAEGKGITVLSSRTRAFSCCGVTNSEAKKNCSECGKGMPIFKTK